MSDEYEAVIGLEVHAQIATRTKMFCGCGTAFGAAPNSQVCPVCLGLPGALPVPNKKAIELAMRAALSLDCTVNRDSEFARKNYFYPDLSKGYQISQFDLPLNTEGYLDITLNGQTKRIGIERIHVEEDAAKNLHGIGAGTDTLVDYNRAGVALIEIVGKPDLRSADETEAYLKSLRDILMFAGVNDGNLEEGSFRCDANVSVRKVGAEKFGTRTELKNINSFKFVKKAIDYEIARQIAMVSAGETIKQETRTWSDPQGKTLSLRSKEEAHDYRYFTDPDLPPIHIEAEWLERVRKELPEPPAKKRARWVTSHGLTPYDAEVMTGHPQLSTYFETCAAALAQVTGAGESAVGKKAANFIQSEVLRYVSYEGLSASFAVSAHDVADLLALVEKGTLSSKMAKDVFAKMVETKKSAKSIVDKEGLTQVADTGAIEAIVSKVLADFPGEVEKYKAGKTTVIGFLVGQAMRASKGAANPGMLNELMKKALDKV